METAKETAASSESSENSGLVARGSQSDSDSGSDYASASSLDMIPIDSLNLKKEIIEVIKADGTLNADSFLENSVKAYAKGGHVMVQADQGRQRFRALVLCALDQVVKEEDSLQVLVISPFRNDASEILSDMKKLNSTLGYNIQLCVAGVATESDRKNLRQQKAQIAIGTPGRVVDCIKQELISTTKVRLLLMDSADKLIGSGFKRNLSLFTLLEPDVQYMLLVQKVTPAVAKFIEDPNIGVLNDSFKQTKMPNGGFRGGKSSSKKKLKQESGPSRPASAPGVTIEDLAVSKRKNVKHYFVFTENDERKIAEFLKLYNFLMQYKTMVVCKSAQVADSVASVLGEKKLDFWYKPDNKEKQMGEYIKEFNSTESGVILINYENVRLVTECSVILHYSLPSNRDFFNKRMKALRVESVNSGCAISFVGVHDISRLISKNYRTNAPICLPEDFTASCF